MKKILLLCFWCCPALLQAQSFTNPILAGFYPDPSICRAGNDYYIVNSSFAYYPGLPIFHSRDLLHWELLGHAMNRPSQLNLIGAGVSRGLFAPAISYHQGTFYIVCTLIDKLGNFVITAKDPAGPWSDPVAMPEVNGIDPSLFFDASGKAYILFNSIPPNNISLHDGHRTIRMYEFDAVNLKVVGAEKLLINGGTDMAKKPVWIEGPHLIQKDGWYYLICAEGGTGYNHSEVVFRSASINGPYVSYEKNPILTQRQLNPNRKHPVTTTGHADFVQAADGKWWAVFLGCRPYEGDYYNAGRETFMAPVEWRQGWPAVNLGGEAVQYRYPINVKSSGQPSSFSGNYFFRDDFNTPVLNKRYSFLRTKTDDWYSLDRPAGQLTLQLRPQTCSGSENPAFVGFRQAHIKGYAATALHFNAASGNEQAGLLVFQNEYHYYYLCQSVQAGKPVVQLFRGPGMQHKTAPPQLLASRVLQLRPGSPLQLKIEAAGGRYHFYYAVRPRQWQLLLANADGKFLSTKVAGGFVGSMYAMYATSGGMPAASTAGYSWFEARNMDDVYRP